MFGHTDTACTWLSDCLLFSLTLWLLLILSVTLTPSRFFPSTFSRMSSLPLSLCLPFSPSPFSLWPPLLTSRSLPISLSFSRPLFYLPGTAVRISTISSPSTWTTGRGNVLTRRERFPNHALDTVALRYVQGHKEATRGSDREEESEKDERGTRRREGRGTEREAEERKREKGAKKEIKEI